jgi:hypothetical protein
MEIFNIFFKNIFRHKILLLKFLKSDFKVCYTTYKFIDILS